MNPLSESNPASAAAPATSEIPEPYRTVAVVGEGVIGLTSAMRLAQAGFQVTVVSRNDLNSTASMSAGAYWWPHKLYPENRVRAWALSSLHVYRELSQQPDSGVFFETHRRYCVDPDDCGYARELLDSWTPIDGISLGLNCVDAYEVRLPVIDVPVFMPFLKELARQLGVTFVQKELASLSELSAEFPVVVNCSGLGARSLSNDESLIPIRGQVLRVSLPAASVVAPASSSQRTSIRVFRKDQHFTLLLPRTNDMILGGTSTQGDWNTSASDTDTQMILKDCSALAPFISQCQLLGTHVGLRPGRPEVRLETEQVTPRFHIIHNYGHGGGGFTVAWGCAEEVVNLLSERTAPAAGPCCERTAPAAGPCATTPTTNS